MERPTPPIPLLLASASPRRRELLARLGVPFTVHPSGADEAIDEPDAARAAEALAQRKAEAAALDQPRSAVIGSDTIVVLDGRMLGKPVDAGDARAMLRSLRGRRHEVITGVALVLDGAARVTHERTGVVMRDYSDDELAAWIASGEAFDKAGAYAIQDPDFAPVAHFEGCECNVIGLPLWTLYRLLADCGIETGAPDLDRCAACPARSIEDERVMLAPGKRWFAWIYGVADRRQRRHTAEVRRSLLGDLHGDILDVGCGPGTNFEHYPPDARVTAIDYNEYMIERARLDAARAAADITLRQADAQALPFADASFDAYVTTLVLCSVPDLDLAVDEAWRVLRPAGEARIFEHMRSSTPWKARVQSLISPAWGVFADGCHLDRDPAAAFRARGFEVIEESHPSLRSEPLPLVLLRMRKPGN